MFMGYMLVSGRPNVFKTSDFRQSIHRFLSFPDNLPQDQGPVIDCHAHGVRLKVLEKRQAGHDQCADMIN